MRDENQEALSALALSVQRAEGYNLLVAISPDAEPPSGVLAGIAELLPEGQTYLSLAGEEADPLQELDRLISGREDRGSLILSGFDRIFFNDRLRPFLTALNLQRSLWIQRIRRTVIFWMPEFLAGEMLRGASDFFDTRSDTLFFIQEGGPSRGAPSLVSFLEAGFVPVQERIDRIAELKARSAIPGLGESRRLEWQVELAGLLIDIGNWQEALEVLGPLREMARRVSPEAFWGVSCAQASALAAGGFQDQALRLFRREVLPALSREELYGGKLGLGPGKSAIGGFLVELLGGAFVFPLDHLANFFTRRIDKAGALAVYAEILEKGNELGPAREAWQKVQELLVAANPRSCFLVISRIIGLLLDEGRIEHAEKLRLSELRPLLTADPEARMALREIGRQWSEFGRKDKALQIEWMLAAAPAASPRDEPAR